MTPTKNVSTFYPLEPMNISPYSAKGNLVAGGFKVANEMALQQGSDPCLQVGSRVLGGGGRREEELSASEWFDVRRARPTIGGFEEGGRGH